MVSKLMKLAAIGALAFACYAAASPFAWQANSKEKASPSDSLMAALQKKAVAILSENCALAGCHAGKNPAMGRVFYADTLVGASVNVPSAEIKTLMLVNPGKPEESYLLLKVRGDKGIKGRRMPLNEKPLKPEQIKTIEQWIESLPADTTRSKGTSLGVTDKSTLLKTVKRGDAE